MAKKRIVILFAMQKEADPFIELLNLEFKGTFDESLPMLRYEGAYERLELTVVTSGKDPNHGVDNVGTQPAAVSTLMAIQSYQLDLVINAGVAAGFANKGSKIGDIYFITEFKYHDRRIPSAPWNAYGIGSYPAVEGSQLASALDLKLSPVSTGDSFDMTSMDEEMIMANQAAVKEMEAASIAWVASLYGKPVMALKVITDLVGVKGTNESQYNETFDRAVESLKNKLVEMLDYIQLARISIT
ncbi:MAG: hypothetical protein V3V61_01665 [Gammaproteobacteria bacterium]